MGQYCLLVTYSWGGGHTLTRAVPTVGSSSSLSSAGSASARHLLPGACGEAAPEALAAGHCCSFDPVAANLEGAVTFEAPDLPEETLMEVRGLGTGQYPALPPLGVGSGPVGAGPGGSVARSTCLSLSPGPGLCLRSRSKSTRRSCTACASRSSSSSMS